MNGLERLQSILSGSSVPESEENENEMTEDWFITGEGEQSPTIQ